MNCYHHFTIEERSCLREYYKKGKNLSRVSPKTLEKNLALINARPKKILFFKKPIDLFNENLSKCCT